MLRKYGPFINDPSGVLRRFSLRLQRQRIQIDVWAEVYLIRHFEKDVTGHLPSSRDETPAGARAIKLETKTLPVFG
jgi:hypothetical protein